MNEDIDHEREIGGLQRTPPPGEEYSFVAHIGLTGYALPLANMYSFKPSPAIVRAWKKLVDRFAEKGEKKRKAP